MFCSFVAGLLIGAVLFTSSIVYAGQRMSLTVEKVPFKYFFNGVQKYPPSDQQGFLYNGRTYVPLRFMAEASGMSVDWDGNDYSIYVTGQSTTSSSASDLSDKNSGNNSRELLLAQDLTPITNTAFMYVNETVTVGGVRYPHSLHASCTSNFDHYAIYNLGGNYSTLKCVVFPDSNVLQHSADVEILGDDRVLWSDTVTDSNLPVSVEVNISGVNKLTLKGHSNFYILTPRLCK